MNDQQTGIVFLCQGQGKLKRIIRTLRKIDRKQDGFEVFHSLSPDNG
jgi:hypothetical protein